MESPTVLVLGSTGGVGQLVVARLLAKGYRVLAAVRSSSKAARLLGPETDSLRFVKADSTDPRSLDSLLAATPIDAAVIATGTSAFPSSKWGPGATNTPRHVDLEGVCNIVDALRFVHRTQKRLRRVVMVSSAGVERFERDAQHPMVHLVRLVSGARAPASTSPSTASDSSTTASGAAAAVTLTSFCATPSSLAADAASTTAATAVTAAAPLLPSTSDSPLASGVAAVSVKPLLTLPYALMDVPAGVLQCKKASEEYLRVRTRSISII